MAIRIVSIGKTNDDFLARSIETYLKRIKKYAIVSWVELPDVKKKLFNTPEELKRLEADLLLKDVRPTSFLIGLDEKGKQFTSREFANKMDHWAVSNSDLVFVIGGAFGFDQKVYNRMNTMISLSKMTLSHQMVRLLLAEQVYRGYSILNGEPYHND
ncbi:MAG: 23S rRNA (pseudouridine(1915)-N(3))-methyltransferase RlmH [Bacteroidia bacterium]|nr:23S rRNA (pseudouridine(1915)-N(3))-methyltransferase RlmH [Bacteroidia bacterium]